MSLSPELRTKAESLVARYPVGRSALLPLLHLVQSQDGYVTEDGIAECAQLLSLTKAEVGAVATFYTMYKRAPLGRHLVSVCTNFSCKVRGAEEVYQGLSEGLGVGHNGTTDDGSITLEHAECLGNCEGAPVVSVDYLNYECLTPQAAAELVNRLRAGEVPPPTRGFPSPGIRAMSHRLAGLGPLDARDGEQSMVDTTAAEPREVRARERAAVSEAAEAAGGLMAGRALHDGVDQLLGVGESGQGTPGGAPEGPGTPQRQAEEAEADQQVRETGLDPDAVERESSYSGREAPTSDPGSEERTSYPDADPRKDDLEPDQPPGERDESRHITSRDQAPDGIADTPTTAELGTKNPDEGDTQDG